MLCINLFLRTFLAQTNKQNANDIHLIDNTRHLIIRLTRVDLAQINETQDVDSASTRQRGRIKAKSTANVHRNGY